MTRRPLATRLAVLMSGLTAATALAGVAAVWLVTSRLEGREVGRALDRSHEVAEGALGRRLHNLELVVGLLGHDAPFRAYVAEGDVPSILDNLQERLALSGCDAFFVTDRSGAILADTRRSGAGAAGAAAAALIAPAHDGHTVSGLWLPPGGRLYLAAAAPIVQGGTDVAGVIVALNEVGDAFATELRGAAGAEIAVYAEGAAAPSGVSFVASRHDLDRLGSSGAARAQIGREAFAARSYPLTSIAGTPVGRIQVLRSMDRELSALSSVQTALLWVGGIAVVLAIASSVYLARRVTRPVAELVKATERIAAGDLEAAVPPASDDEMGALADAFRTMVRELKDKADMETYLASVVRGAGEPSVAGASAASESTVTHDVRVLAGRFALGRVLGTGGMGTVYLAFDRTVGERVALKVLNDGARDAERWDRFVQEVRLARRITHRNVVRTHDVVALEPGWALSMEYVEGLSLAALMRRGPLPFAAALGIARQIASGLEAAHSQGIVHRDLKPGNVLLDDRGVAKIADFGLAHIQGSLDGQASGRISGTPHYMSPEQAQGRATDARSDVYACGVMFFQLFCGSTPFEAPTLAALLDKQVREAPPRPRSLRADLPEDVERVILRALEKDPASRFPSARELSEELKKKRAGVATGPFHERPELS